MHDIFWAFDTRFIEAKYAFYANRLQSGLPLVTDKEIALFRKTRHKHVLPQNTANIESENSYSSAYVLSKNNIARNIQDVETNSIGVVEIFGAVTKWGDMCSYGTKDWGEQINAMLQNPNVDAILLHVDSPGGSVDGTEELANIVAKAQKQKPIVTFADGLMASAGYWIGSQANYIYASSATTSWVGSIGTLLMHVDKSLYLQKEGYTVRILTADRSTEKVLGNSYEPLTPEAEASFKADLNTINDTFIKAINRARGEKITKEKDVFTGATFNGIDAKRYGLIDNIGTFQNAVNKARELAKVREIQKRNS